MARNILEFFHPVGPDNFLEQNDLIHLGRDRNTTVSQKDIVLSGTELFDSFNAQGALVGQPSVAGDNLTADVREKLVNWGSELGYAGTLDEAAGTITITGNATYRINLGLVCHVPLTDNFAMVAYVVWDGGASEIIMSASSIPSASGAAPDAILNLTGMTMVSLTVGDVLTIEVSSSATISSVTFPNGFIEIQPTSIT